jgi:hypothetical protein
MAAQERSTIDFPQQLLIHHFDLLLEHPAGRQSVRGHDIVRIGAEFDGYAQFSARDRFNKECANHLLVICTSLPDPPASQPAADG